MAITTIILILQVVVLLGIITHITTLYGMKKVLEERNVNHEFHYQKPIKTEKLADCDNILKRKPKYKDDVGWYEEEQRKRKN